METDETRSEDNNGRVVKRRRKKAKSDVADAGSEATDAIETKSDTTNTVDDLPPSVKARLTRYENQVRALERERDDAIAERDAAVEEVAAHLHALHGMQAERDAAIAAHDEAIAQLDNAALEANHPARQRRSLGTLRTDGLLVLMSAFTADEQWRTGQAARTTAIDFTGPLAKSLAGKLAPHATSTEELPDGTCRVVMPTAMAAQAAHSQAVKYIAAQEDPTSAVLVPLGASTVAALDATRAEPAGVIAIHGQPAIAALRGSDTMTVYVEEGPQGEVLGLFVGLS